LIFVEEAIRQSRAQGRQSVVFLAEFLVKDAMTLGDWDDALQA